MRCMVQDITERKRVEEVLEEKNRRTGPIE